jgi:VWFA-related protein
MKKKSLNLLLGFVFSIFFIFTCGGGSGSNNPADTPNISISPSTFDFAGTVLNNYTDRTLIIKNTGNATLNIGQISSPSVPFSISSDTASNKTLTPTETCSLMVRYSPTSQGSSTGIFSIPSDDPDSPTVNVQLKGEGYGLNVWISKVDTTNCLNKIKVDVSVSDPSGLLTGLTANNFALKQNGSQRMCDVFENYTLDPVSVVLALDFSSSLTADLDAIKTAAKTFINLLRDEDEAAVCRFRAEIDFFPEITPLFITTDDSGKKSLEDYIDSAFNATDGTILYDAVYNSIDRAAEGTKNELAVIVLSDGVNTNTGVNSLQQIIDNAKLKGIPVFSIFYVDLAVYPNSTPDIMQQLAIDTGGQYYNSGDSDELQSIFTQISYVLNKKYTLEYYGGICTGSINLAVQASSGGWYGVDSKTIDLP